MSLALPFRQAIGRPVTREREIGPRSADSNPLVGLTFPSETPVTSEAEFAGIGTHSIDLEAEVSVTFLFERV